MTKPDGESGKEPERLDEPPKTPDAADGRMADLLASGRASGELRRQLPLQFFVKRVLLQALRVRYTAPAQAAAGASL